MAPELVNKTKYTHKADIWSVGVILFNLLNGETPFQSRTVQEFQQKHKISDYKMKERSIPKLTLETILFMSQCLQTYELGRADINTLFNHPYITKPFNEQTPLDEGTLNDIFPYRNRQ